MFIINGRGDTAQSERMLFIIQRKTRFAHLRQILFQTLWRHQGFRRVVMQSFLMHYYTPKTLMSPHSLKENLALIRKMGFSHDDEEHALGLRCVAAPIYDEHGEPFAAISISGPIARMTDDRITELGALVIRAAKGVTQTYSGR